VPSLEIRDGVDGWRASRAPEVGACPRRQARVAAETVADFERRIGTLVSVNTAVLAMNTTLVVAVAGRLFQFS
jgi:hypothetical protein